MSTRQRLTLSSRLEVANNIPSSRLKSLVDAYRTKMKQADELLFDCHELKAKIRAITGDKS